jgi:RNA polymerase sigma factor (sigma-70 family)
MSREEPIHGRATLKKDWVLSREAFEVLLLNLDPDPERAGARYEHLRRALITFFEYRGSTAPEELTDDTMNRVARRLLEGQTMQAGHPAAYFYGVARNVLKEYWEASARSPRSLDSQPAATPRSPDPHQLQEQLAGRQLREERLEALERCLEQLAAKDRDLIGQYYLGETGVKIQNRRRLADRLGIALNALRIRALRIREKLEACVERRLLPSAPPRNDFQESP